MPSTPSSNPYIGPRSFQTGEAIYGRNREVRELLGLLIAERIVLLHSPSGAGKTSLVQAALIPRLQEQDFAVLPVMRVSLDPPLATTDHRPPTTDRRPQTADSTSASSVVSRQSSVVGRQSSVVNRYLLSLLLSLEEDLPPEQQLPLDQLATLSLADYLDQRPRASESDGEVLIFDQFEEILTIEPTNLAAKTAFFAQVGAALRDRRRWALFSMREDYVAALAPYLRAIPTRLGRTYRLDLLGAATAHAAIQEPARQRGVDFEDAAAARLIDDLRQVQVQRSDGSIEEQLGPTVEPVQLQVVCYRLWEKRFGVPTTDDGPPTTDGRPPTTDDERHETSDERPEALDGGPAVVAPSPTADHRPLTTDDEAGASNSSEPTLVDSTIIHPDDQSPISNLQSPISNTDSASTLVDPKTTITNDQLLITSDQSPISNLQSPISNLPVAAQRITSADVEAVGDVNSALADYYTERVAVVAANTGVSERSIREWFDRRLITTQGIRGQVLQAQGQSEGLDNRAIWPLIDAYLVRAEKRRGATWFELAHDRLIDPVRDDNAAWRAAHLSTLQRQADLWDSQGRPDGLLLRDAPLIEAEAWAATNGIALTAIEQDFLDRCREVREIIQRARRNNRIVRVLAIVASIIGIVAIAAAGIAFVARGQAEQARIDAEQARTEAEQARGQAEQARTQAEQARTEAEQARDEAIARQLAAQSYDASEQAPQRALLLGIEAVSQKGSPHLSVAETALYTALATAGGRPLYGHTQIINALAFSPDGRTLASASDDQTVLLWALGQPGAAPAPPQQLFGHTQRVTALAFSPDGRTLATASDDGSARLWNVAEPGAAPVVLAHGSAVIALAFSPDGRTLASASADGSVRLWSMAQPTAAPIILANGTAATNVLAFSPNGRTLAAGGDDNMLRLWNMAQPSAPPDQLAGHEGPIRALAFSPDGRTLATASDDGSAQLWDMQRPDSPSIVLEGHLEAVTVLAFSPDGHLLATGSRDKNVQLWNVEDILRAPNRERVPRALVLSGHNSEVTGLVFVPDGRTLISASHDGTKRLWDIERPGVTLAVLRGHEGPIAAMALGPDGHTLATGSDDRTVRLWNLGATSAIPQLHDRESSIAALALSPDGHLLATGGTPEGFVQIWNRDDLGAGPTLLGTHEDRVNAIAFSPDGRTLASGGDDQTIRLWDITNPQAAPVELGGATEGIAALLFGADGRTLLAASFDGAVLRWDLDTQTSTTVLPAETVGGFIVTAFSPDGRYLATDDASELVLLWDLTAPEAQPFGFRGHEQATVALAFSPDGHTLASGSNDRTVRLWNIEDRTANALVLRGHIAAVQALAFSQDGRTLATGSADTTIRMWQIANPDEPIVLSGHTDPLTALAFSPDGRTLVSSDVDRTIWLWPTEERELIDRACATAGRNLTWDEWQESLEDLPYRKTCPSQPISPSLIDVATGRATAGDIKGALDLVEQVDKLGGTNEIPASSWSRLCRAGTLVGVPAQFSDICERAVAMDPDNGLAHDDRGLARALTNDIPGAIEDFELYVAWAQQHGGDAEQIARRETWIAELKAGRNPFTQTVLDELRTE